MTQTITLTFQVSQLADLDLLLRIVQQMSGLRIIEQTTEVPEKKDLSRFFGVLSHYPIEMLDQDFNRMRDEWDRGF